MILIILNVLWLERGSDYVVYSTYVIYVCVSVLQLKTYSIPSECGKYNQESNLLILIYNNWAPGKTRV